MYVCDRYGGTLRKQDYLNTKKPNIVVISTQLVTNTLHELYKTNVQWKGRVCLLNVSPPKTTLRVFIKFYIWCPN
jgi:hypothetical protein